VPEVNGGIWQRQVVDAKAEWWAVEANGGGWRHVVNAAEENGGRHGGCRS